MNRSQLRAKDKRRVMRIQLIKGKTGYAADIAWREYYTWLYLKGWMWNDPKKIAKRNSWIPKMKNIFK